MRTSEDTATCHRAEAYVNHFVKKNGDEIDHLTKQQSVLRKQITMITDECKKLVQLEEGFVNAENEAVAAHNRSRDILTMFKAQARQFFNNGNDYYMLIQTNLWLSIYISVFYIFFLPRRLVFHYYIQRQQRKIIKCNA